MSVTSVRETYVRSGKQNAQWQREYSRSWIVETDSPYDGAYTVLQSLPVQLGNYYAEVSGTGTVLAHDFGSFCNDLSAHCTSEDGCTWECQADYKPWNPALFPRNPLAHPIKVAWGRQKFERVAQVDTDGNAVLNSAGDYFDPPLTIDDSRPILRIQRNEASYDPSLAETYKDAINSDLFFGQQPGTWKCAAPTADLEFNIDAATPDGFYYSVTYEFEFRSEGWESQVLDQGLKVLDASGKQVAATENGQAVSSPILLDGDGKALASGDDPVFLTFKVYKKTNFAPLGLDPAGAPGQGF